MIDTTAYVTAPHGSIWHPDVWVLLPFLLRTKQQAQENAEIREIFNKLEDAVNEITNHNSVFGDPDDIQMDILQVGVDNGLYEEWRLDHFRPSQRRKRSRELWEQLVENGGVDEYVAYLLTNQIIEGKGKARCPHCRHDYWREFIQPAGGTTDPGMPMIYWLDTMPEDWGRQGPGDFQYDSICGKTCWDCGIDGIPAGPPHPESATTPPALSTGGAAQDWAAA